ncbi:uncharacterized protein FIBRA_06338 [Fibroporia radiculosa]|uniref:Uncharacterized protein n=1 Tax=Fibroporia radiculosa TaxID=599839 RepID=J4IB76_9APHY|nr:uncharacterized protein FIBRA_06338 [Fibroporia radiculosa]CCM04176.1 predicted protein [Fibroporia radiculosa]
MTADLGINFVATEHHDTYPAINPSRSDLKGKVVFITGASKGIGRSMAIAFAQAGVSGLILAARSDMSATKAAVEAAQRPGHQIKVLTVALDASNLAQVESAAAKVEETFGRVDILVNNAGYLGAYGLIGDSDPQEAWKAWSVNVLGTYAVTRAFLPLVLKSSDKTIIIIGSLAGLAKMPNLSAYQTSKLALLRFTELLMTEYGDKGILALCVHPGVIETDMADQVPDVKAGGFGTVDTPELSAHTLTWLVRERRDWLAGRYVSSQWDMEELSAKKQEIIQGDKLKVKMVV